MAHIVVWSEEAQGDLERIADFIARDSPAYATAVVRKVLESTRRLADFPFSGRTVPEVGDTAFREVLVSSYRVIYRIEGETVTVAAVAHTRQSLRIDDV